MPDELTDKQEAFITHYPACLNATKAAKLAGYRGSSASLAVIGCKLLKEPEIAARIKERMTELAMGADEVLLRLGQQARGELSDYLKVGQDGKPYIHVRAVKKDGKEHLIKEISYDRRGNAIVRSYDAQAALNTLAKTHGLLDRFDPAEALADLTAALAGHRKKEGDVEG